VPGIAAVAGAVLTWFDERKLTALLVPVLVIFFIIMGTEGRYFGRWLMPVLPMICLLSAYAMFKLADFIAGFAPRLRPTLVAAAVVALCAQGLVHSVHSDLINSRADTRNLTRAWMLANIPACSKVVIEPVVPDAWVGPVKGVTPCANPIYSYSKFPSLVTHVDALTHTLTADGGTPVNIEDFETTLQPALINVYLKDGYCWVITGETQDGRAEVDPGAVPQALPYYAALARNSTLVYESSPYGSGEPPVKFNFDWTFDYYPLNYTRPGPTMRVYHLNGCSE
jgi:hypothetical protein